MSADIINSLKFTLFLHLKNHTCCLRLPELVFKYICFVCLLKVK